MTHDSILEFLLQKNLQFQRGAETGNRIQNESQPVYREELARGGQAPIATVVTCCDSRVVPEIIFQQGFGKLFIVRTAGGVVWSPPVLGSIQFGVETFKTPLLMVLGHTECGAAITGWTICQEKGKMHELSPSLQALVEPMEHLVDSISKEHPSRELSTQTASRKLSEAIAKDGVRRILNELSSLRKLTETGQLGVVSGIYDVHDGSVTIMEKSWEKKHSTTTKQPTLDMSRCDTTKIARQLYKALLREGKKFPNDRRSDYVCKLTRQEFRQHRNEQEASRIDSLLVYAMDQLENLRHLREVFEKGEEAHHIGIHSGIVRVLRNASFLEKKNNEEPKSS
eukprot:jgi/Galph1/3945/GphlegSOOS_G2599.1